MDSLFANPYFHIVAGVVLIGFSYLRLQLNPRRVMELIAVFFGGFSTSPTSREKEQLEKEGVTLPLGCWTMLMGIGLVAVGIVRLIAVGYHT
jgi:hypothetical protein